MGSKQSWEKRKHSKNIFSQTADLYIQQSFLSSLGFKATECIYARLWGSRTQVYEWLTWQHVWKGRQGVYPRTSAYMYLFGIVLGSLVDIVGEGNVKVSLPQQ